MILQKIIEIKLIKQFGEKKGRRYKFIYWTFIGHIGHQTEEKGNDSNDLVTITWRLFGN